MSKLRDTEIDENDQVVIRNCKVLSSNCAGEWRHLDNSSTPNVKFCDLCENEVFYCQDNEEILEALRFNRTMAIDRFTLEVVVDENIERKNFFDSITDEEFSDVLGENKKYQ